MADYSQVLATLSDFRTTLARQRQSATFSASVASRTSVGTVAGHASAIAGAFSAFATPFTNIHATGIGIRQRGGEYITHEFVLKVFVFDKLTNSVVDDVFRTFQNVPVDVEPLPVQVIRELTTTAPSTHNVAMAAPSGSPASQRGRFNPMPGGVSISPLNASFVGTLGCFVKRKLTDTEQVFVLSNNHVLANVDSLPVGTPIVQPGPEQPPFTTNASDAFAALHTAVPIRFPGPDGSAPINRFDAAIANVTQWARVRTGAMFGGLTYRPENVTAPKPGMRVMKAGRTTGVTHGTITATHVQGLQVNYSEFPASRIATFADTIRVAGDGGAPFSMPGDSGSVILEEATGNPVALLFAGDGQSTSAFELGPVCQFFNAWPV